MKHNMIPNRIELTLLKSLNKLIENLDMGVITFGTDIGKVTLEFTSNKVAGNIGNGETEYTIDGGFNLIHEKWKPISKDEKMSNEKNAALVLIHEFITINEAVLIDKVKTKIQG